MLAELLRADRGIGMAAIALAALASPPGPLAAMAPVHGPTKTKAAHPKDKPAHPKRKDAQAGTKQAVPEQPRSEAAKRLMAWIAASHDNGAMPYAVIDKQAATLFLFAADGTPLGQTPVLIGVGVGDDSSPGVGAKSLAEIGPAERTTPAGRFVAKFGLAFGHTRVLWVDYADSVALHAVITTHKQEHRVERLLSPTPDDNRITFGCINVGTAFYTKQVSPVFRKNGGIVYILPDTKPLDEVFPRLRLLPYLNTTSPGEGSGQTTDLDAPEPAGGSGAQ